MTEPTHGVIQCLGKIPYDAIPKTMSNVGLYIFLNMYTCHADNAQSWPSAAAQTVVGMGAHISRCGKHKFERAKYVCQYLWNLFVNVQHLKYGRRIH